MKLTRVKLHGFGAFNKGVDVAFSQSGLNLVVGRNEAGKSTLLSGILGVLFGFRDLNLVRKYEPWDDHDAYAGEVSMDDGEGRILTVWRDFRSNQARITAGAAAGEGDDELLFDGIADPRANTDDAHSYYKLLGKVLGFRDETVFRNTVFFGQSSLQTEISDQIRRLLSGSTEVDYKGALHELHSQYSELTNENPWRTKGKRRNRLIEETSSRLKEDRKAWKEGRDTLVKSLELEDEITRLQHALAQSEEETQRVSHELAGNERVHALLLRREAAQSRYKEALERRDGLRRYSVRIEEIDRTIDSKFSHFRSVPADLPTLVHDYATAEAELAQVEGKIRNEKQHLANLREVPNVRLGWTLGIGLFLVGALGAMLVPVAPAIVLLIGTAAGAVGTVVGRKLATGFSQQRAAIVSKIGSFDDAAKKQRKRIMGIEGQVGPLLVGRSEADVLSEYNRLLELKEEKKQVQAALKALGQQSQVDAQFDACGREQGTVEASLEQVIEEWPELEGQYDKTAVSKTINRLRQRGEQLRAGYERDRSRLESARVEIATLSARMDFDLASIEETIRDKEYRLDAYDLERDALKEAIDVLDECIQDFQENDVHRLAEEISGIFSKITGEKYVKVHLGAGLEPIISRGDHVPITPADLSQGARDQLYFAMRVAMARHLARQVRLPLFLDDPFVNFDQHRLDITKNVLDQLDEEHQVIMVTCDRGYVPWTEQIIDLDKIRAATV